MATTCFNLRIATCAHIACVCEWGIVCATAGTIEGIRNMDLFLTYQLCMRAWTS